MAGSARPSDDVVVATPAASASALATSAAAARAAVSSVSSGGGESDLAESVSSGVKSSCMTASVSVSSAAEAAREEAADEEVEEVPFADEVRLRCLREALSLATASLLLSSAAPVVLRFLRCPSRACDDLGSDKKATGCGSSRGDAVLSMGARGVGTSKPALRSAACAAKSVSAAAAAAAIESLGMGVPRGV